MAEPGFQDNFQADPECEGRSLPWVTAKPLLLNAIVQYAPLYPEFPKLKTKKVTGSVSDPGSPFAKLFSDTVEVIAYSSKSDEDENENENKNKNASAKENAWQFILANANEIEASLRRKLFAYHIKNLEQFLQEYLPDSKAMQKYWKEIEQNVDVRSPSAVDHLFKLTQIGLADTGLDESGFCSFEFQTGWDRDHGLGILMHKTKVLAGGGVGELVYSPQHIVAAVQSVQSYDFDEGDFRLA